MSSASRVANPEAVRDAIRAGENDFLESFLQLLTATGGTNAPKLQQLKAALSHRLEEPAPRVLSPWAYLCYYAIGSSQLLAHKMAHPAIDQIIAEITHDQAPGEVICYGDPSRVSPELWSLMLDHFQQGGDFVGGLEAPNPDIADHFRAGIEEARHLIQEADNELAGLLCELQPMIILCQPDKLSRARGEIFGGATCFFFRGGNLINASNPCSLTSIIEQLVHEYAHAELFVLSQNEQLCLNHDDERHSVMIRPDPRPMNGILHSLYVVARVAEFLTKLIQVQAGKPAICNPAVLDGCRSQLAKQHELGQSSLEVIRKYARLSSRGEAIVSACILRLAFSEDCGF